MDNDGNNFSAPIKQEILEDESSKADITESECLLSNSDPAASLQFKVEDVKVESEEVDCSSVKPENIYDMEFLEQNPSGISEGCLTNISVYPQEENLIDAVDTIPEMIITIKTEDTDGDMTREVIEVTYDSAENGIQTNDINSQETSSKSKTNSARTSSSSTPKNIDQNKYLFECHKCKYKTDNRSYVEACDREDEESSGQYFCLFCNYQMKNRESHTSARVQKTVTLHSCNHCGYKTESLVRLKKHVESKHNRTVVTLYKCAICSYFTKSRYDYNNHLKQKHDKFIKKT